MLRLLFLAILLTGCSNNYSPHEVQSAPSQQDLMEPYRTTRQIQSFGKKSIGLGFVIVGAIAILVLKKI